jgi:hypothetical protein
MVNQLYILYKPISRHTYHCTLSTRYNPIYYELTIPIGLNTKPRNEPLAIKVLCIYYKTTSIYTTNLAIKMEQITTNLQIATPYINALAFTPINTKVQKYPTWQKILCLSNNTWVTNPTPPIPTYTNNKPKNLYHAYVITPMDHSNPQYKSFTIM